MMRGKGGGPWSTEAQAQRAALLQKHPELVQTNALLNATTNLSGMRTSAISVLSVSNKTNAARAPGK